MPRSICAIAVVIDSSEKNSPTTSAISPARSPVCPLVTADASASRDPPPGESCSMVRASTRAGPLVVDVGGEPGQREQERYDGQGDLQGQGAGCG